MTESQKKSYKTEHSVSVKVPNVMRPGGSPENDLIKKFFF